MAYEHADHGAVVIIRSDDDGSRGCVAVTGSNAGETRDGWKLMFLVIL